MLGTVEYLLIVLLFAILVTSVRNWLLAWRDRRDGKSILPAEHRDQVPWGLLDMLLIVAIIVMTVGSSAAISRQAFGIPSDAELDALTPRQQSVVFAAFGVASLLATLLSLLYLHLRWQGTLTRHGFSSSRLGEDVALGFRWFTMLAVPVLLLQLVLNPKVTTRQLARIAAALGSQVAPAGEHFYVYGEYVRLARPVYFLAMRDELGEHVWADWFEGLATPVPFADWLLRRSPRK